MLITVFVASFVCFSAVAGNDLYFCVLCCALQLMLYTPDVCTMSRWIYCDVIVNTIQTEIVLVRFPCVLKKLFPLLEGCPLLSDIRDSTLTSLVLSVSERVFVSDIPVFVLKRDVKL